MIHHGDCLEVMAAMEPESVDAICTDPPYGLEFMGKEWDRLDAGLPQENVWKGRRGKGGGDTSSTAGDDNEFTRQRNGALPFGGGGQRVTYGGGKHGFKRCAKCGKRAFSGSPCICPDPEYVVEYNQSAPSASIRMGRWHQQWAEAAYRVAKPSAYLLAFGGTRTVHRMTVALEDAGWIIRDMLVWAYASGFPKSKASLKPAWEPIVLARKPGPLRMLAIDSCRIPGEPWQAHDATGLASVKFFTDGDTPVVHKEPHTLGRWPANVLLTSPIFDGGWDGVVGGGEQVSRGPAVNNRLSEWSFSSYAGTPEGADLIGYGDSGTYSRFFLVPKADRADREPVLPSDIAPRRETAHRRTGPMDTPFLRGETFRVNAHPTVKPTELMRHLVRLVTPPGGIVLDPFLGSGSTGLACEQEGFAWIGIEKEAEYVEIARARLNGTQRGLAL